ncbi:DegT/DnrJ/EryC1/StrS family aminotransferase [Alsobacter sp. KACC 23698]|uniref:DegT/DnrJ/EryC1/StrS family aminotransferase n=1 Tax=Alsobacter sp. KACC 23698 TaxID=3149229 RepID=A0AAU7JIT8_9HYPH
MPIPFVDLKAQYGSIKDEIDEAIGDVLASASFIGGPPVDQFEQDFAEYSQVRHAIGVANGTDALQLALTAANIGPGDEVITAANSFIASAAAIARVGATPVFADVRRSSWTIDPVQVERAVTARTKAIMPIHLFGTPADMDEILEIARRHALLVIEDAAQAHGARYKGRRIGSFGQMACFSFYPSKNLGCFGDGGAITTSDDVLASRIRLLRDHGRASKYEHSEIGFNSRLDTLQAAVLCVKLRHLDRWNQRRQQIASWYAEDLDGSGIETPERHPDRSQVHHLYPVLTEDRDALQSRLEAAGVSTGIHYPIPIHLQPAFAHLGYREGDMPQTEFAAKRSLSLPMFPELTREQARSIARVARQPCDALIKPSSSGNKEPSHVSDQLPGGRADSASRLERPDRSLCSDTFRRDHRR